MLSKGLLYVTVQKIQECVGGTSYYEELTGEEGEASSKHSSYLRCAGITQNAEKRSS